MQENLHRFRTLLHRRFLDRVLEPEILHSFQKDWCFVAAGVGEDRLAARREQLRHELGECSGILTLVEDVGGENEVEGPDTLYVRFAPVEEDRIRFQVQVRAGIVGGEVEGGLVVVCREYACAADEREDGGQPDAATKLDGAGTRKVAF